MLIVLAFLTPLLILVAHLGEVRFPDASEIWPYIASASWQGFWSGTLSLIIGAFIAIGLLSVSSDHFRRALEICFLIPSLLPGIFIVLSILQISSLFQFHPIGYGGVIAANVAMSAGLVGVFLQRAFRNKVGGFAELAYIEGASPWQTLKTVTPLLGRDLLSMFLGVFIFSFLGFSIPLILGGLEAATLEVQIYRKVLAEGAISEALALCLLQVVFIALFAQIIPLRAQGKRVTHAYLEFLGNRFALVMLFVLTAILLMAPATNLMSGAEAVLANEFLRGLVIKAAASTFIIAVTAGLLTVLLGMLMVYLWPPCFIERFFIAYSAPSAVLIGFGFYLLGVQSAPLIVQLLVLGFVLGTFFWPSLYRLSFHLAADSLRGQYEIAHQMGASAFQVFREVAWPQMRPTVFMMAALTALWAAGDFGISSILSIGDSSLALLVKSLISRYRLAEATFILWILVLVAILSALIFVGVSRVGNRKSQMSL